MAFATGRRNSTSSATSIPLLVQDPSGATRQLDVPADANVDDIKSLILADSSTKDGVSLNDFKLAIGDAELEPGLSLADTPVIPAYNYATSLLQVIGNSGLEPDKTAEALNSVNGVVRSLSNGVTDVNALCAAAGSSVRDSLTTPSMFEVGNSVNELFPSIGPNQSAGNTGWADAPSPALLVRKLSKTLPNHFGPEASQDFIRNSMRSELGDFPNMDDVAAFERIMPPPGGQPSIQDIAKARRSAKRAKEGALNDEQLQALFGTDSRTGSGNLAVPDLATQSAAAAASGFGKKSAIMAPNGESTWMENVMTTWAVGLVQNSGALDKDKTPDGVKLKNHLEAIDNDKEMADAAAHPSDEDTNLDGSSMDVDNESTHSSAPSHMSVPGVAPPVVPPSLPQASEQGNKNSTAQMNAVPATTVQMHQGQMGVGPFLNGQPNKTGVSPTLRRATPIAPSPVPSNSGSAGGVASTAPQTSAGTATKVQFPIKRGRKLKNPGLTAEERKQMRKEQKRKSARESRIRKKTLEENYQLRLKWLIGENGCLKKQVNDLTHRLQVLQGLLTVTVRPVQNRPGMPQPGQLAAQPATLPQNPAAHLGNGGPMGGALGSNPMGGAIGGNPMGFPGPQQRFDNTYRMSHAPAPPIGLSQQPAFGQREPNPSGGQPLLTRSVRTQLSIRR